MILQKPLPAWARPAGAPPGALGGISGMPGAYPPPAGPPPTQQQQQPGGLYAPPPHPPPGSLGQPSQQQQQQQRRRPSPPRVNRAAEANEANDDPEGEAPPLYEDVIRTHPTIRLPPRQTWGPRLSRSEEDVGDGDGHGRDRARDRDRYHDRYGQRIDTSPYRNNGSGNLHSSSSSSRLRDRPSSQSPNRRPPRQTLYDAPVGLGAGAASRPPMGAQPAYPWSQHPHPEAGAAHRHGHGGPPTPIFGGYPGVGRIPTSAAPAADAGPARLSNWSPSVHSGPATSTPGLFSPPPGPGPGPHAPRPPMGHMPIQTMAAGAPPPGAVVVRPGDPRIGGVLCQKCGGTGVRESLWWGDEVCSRCRGMGRVMT